MSNELPNMQILQIAGDYLHIRGMAQMSKGSVENLFYMRKSVSHK